MTNKERCSLNRAKDIIPDAGLGEFIEGYTSKREGHPYKSLLWLLVPIIGWIVVPMLLIVYCLKRYFRDESFIYLYDDGFLWMVKSFTGKSKEYIVRYDEVGGMMAAKTRNYQTHYYVIKIYTGTSVAFNVCDKEGVTLLSLSIFYNNEHEKDDKYDACGFALNAILDKWHAMALERANREISEQGFARFFTLNKGSMTSVDIGRGFIKTEGNYAGENLRYAFQDGLLYIYPSEEDRNFSNEKKYFTINVNSMYDNQIFFLAASQLLGIK